MNRDMARILTFPDMREREATLGYRFIGGSPDQLDAMLSHEIAKWAEVAEKRIAAVSERRRASPFSGRKKPVGRSAWG